MPKKASEPPLEHRDFTSVGEIDRAIKKLERRINEVEALDVDRAVTGDSGEDDAVESNIRETIREVFGTNSPEFREHQYVSIWAGPMFMDMSPRAVVDGKTRGKTQVTGILRGLIGRLQEKREDCDSDDPDGPVTYFQRLNLHPRIAEVANDLYLDRYFSEAVFAAAKALVNMVKEKSGRHDLDGAALMRAVFSRNNPVLMINEMATQTDQDEQEGFMHLFEGAVLALRNPGGHDFPQGSPQRALEYIQLLSLLAYQVQEAKRRPRG